MAGPCKCAREHDPVSLAEWTWQMRELKPKPPPGYLGILWMLAARLDVRTGCGWASVRDLSELSGAGRNTVLRATAWARNHGLLARTARGHRVTDERDAASQWQLLDAGQS